MSRRIEKINELLQQELSKLILIEEKNLSPNCIITVMEVETAEDLKTAKVWASVLDGVKKSTQSEKIIKKVQHLSFQFQKELSRKLTLKFIPKLTFKLDTTGERAQKIDKILNEIK